MKFRNAAAFVIFVFAFLALAGCAGIFGGESPSFPTQPPSGGGRAGFERTESTGVAGAPSPDLGLPKNLVDTSGNLVIKTGDVDIEVPQGTLEAKLNELKGIVTSSGGTIDSISYSETESSKTYYLTVKVPPTSFEALSERLKGVGRLKSQRLDTEDVTLQWVDLETRIQNLQAERQRLLELYNRSGDVKDIIEVERELTRVQTELEYAQARKIRLERQVALSTITITLREEAPVVESALIVPLSAIVGAFLGALGFGILLVAGASGFFIPIVLVLAILGFIAKKLWDRIKRKQEQKGKK